MRSLVTFFLILAVPVLAKTYSVDGIVVAVDAGARTMLVSHREIAHYMPAMLMPFHAGNAAELAALHPGAQISFELVVTKGRSVAHHIRPAGAPDSALPAPAEKLTIGAALPDFQLTDQQGALSSRSRPARQSGGHRFHRYALPAARRVPAAFGELRHAPTPLSRAAWGRSAAALGDGGPGVRYAAGARRIRAPLGRRIPLALPHGRCGSAGRGAGRNLLGRRRLHRPTIPPPQSSGATDAWPLRWKARTTARINWCT